MNLVFTQGFKKTDRASMGTHGFVFFATSLQIFVFFIFDFRMLFRGSDCKPLLTPLSNRSEMWSNVKIQK